MSYGWGPASLDAAFMLKYQTTKINFTDRTQPGRYLSAGILSHSCSTWASVRDAQPWSPKPSKARPCHRASEPSATALTRSATCRDGSNFNQWNSEMYSRNVDPDMKRGISGFVNQAQGDNRVSLRMLSIK